MMERSFDPETSEFTLEVIMNFGFDSYAVQINDISVAATKELAIENVCGGLECDFSNTITRTNCSYFDLFRLLHDLLLLFSQTALPT